MTVGAFSSPCEGEEEIYVIGGGIAGLAVCARLQERGRRPVLLSKGVGATEMSSGAADFTPWTEPGSGEDLNSDLGDSYAWATRFLSTFGCFVGRVEGSEPSRVVSFEGVVRPADQVARGLLELRALSQATIGVWDLPRQDWRASALCISLLENTWVRERGLRFVPLSLPDLVSDAECSLPLAAFVHLFDEPERQRGFLSRLDALREKTGVDALLTGPWLGSTTALFEVGSMFPFGESLSPPEGPFGFRFARAREAWLSSRKIDCHNERVVALRKVDDGVEIDCFLDHGERRIRKAGLCIVATGGLVGGGVELLFDASGSALGSPLDSGPRSPSGALEGWDPQADGGLWLWPPHQGEGARANRGLIFAGDVCGPSENLLLRRGTILSACASGKVAADCLSKGARCALSEE